MAAIRRTKLLFGMFLE